ncbi:Aste57867_18583 [Aphanomyces stellatus]|uniref:Ubiquitin carboxyl-terminal hydrolase n=1 Tax=Aphanomyces stellatus TaxID=120398 RepID=A0A485LAT8_9STRA|nr:hypothetical protein As57867_018521 [Aphanomyces stellatus]VFT95318.1 Aste57867_18583 [Aphanomyces stellatus]
MEANMEDEFVVSNSTLSKGQKKKNRKKAKKKVTDVGEEDDVGVDECAAPLPTYPIAKKEEVHAGHIPLARLPVVPSPASQKVIIQRLLSQSKTHGMTVGERYFVVNFKWWESWCNHVHFHDDDDDNAAADHSAISSSPPKIDNTGLLDPILEHVDAEGVRMLRPQLIEHVHFILIPSEVWDAVVVWYGGGPAICRYVVGVGAPNTPQFLTRVELYPGVDDVEMDDVSSDASPASSPTPATTVRDVVTVTKPMLCMVCHRPSTNRCGHCKHCIYCSKTCQVAHWKYHKLHCTRIKANAGAVATIDIHGRQGLAGLKNLGNTCFMNAALQCLSHTTSLTTHFLNNAYHDDLNTDNVLGTGGKLATQYALLLKELWFGTSSSASPGLLKRAIGTYAPQFSGYQQHDAQELLAYLLDGLHEDVNRIQKKPYIEAQDSNGSQPDAVVAAQAWANHCLRNESIFVDQLHGQFKSKVVCPTCNKISITFDPFNCVQLELPHAVTRPIEVIVMPRLTRATVLADEANVRPVKYGLQIHKRGNVKSIKMALAEAGCQYTNMVICDVFNHMVYRVLPDLERMMRVRSDDRLVVYPQPPKTANCILFCYHRFYEKNREPQLFGDPLITSLDRTTTFDQFLGEMVLQLVPMFGWTVAERKERIDNKGVRSMLAKHIYVTNQDGINLNPHALSEFEGYAGSAPVMATLFLNDSAHLGIDWDGDLRDLYHVTEPYILSHPSLKTLQVKSDTLSLDECFKKFTSPEQLDEDNLWYCSTCKEHRQATKTMQLYKLPEVLVLSLKRFEYRNEVVRDKLDTMVEFPLEGLDMAPYCLSAADDDHSMLYDLYAVTNHFGSMGFGHYTAYAKDQATNLWYTFDDSSVTSVSAASVVSNAAYILFYKRRQKK